MISILLKNIFAGFEVNESEEEKKEEEAETDIIKKVIFSALRLSPRSIHYLLLINY